MLRGYEQVKRKLNAANRRIADGHYAEADALVREAVKEGATPHDLYNLLGPAGMKAMKAWARRQKKRPMRGRVRRRLGAAAADPQFTIGAGRRRSRPMRRRGQLGGPVSNHVHIAKQYVREAERMLAEARTCKDLASIKWTLGGAYENSIWATGDERMKLDDAIGEVNSKLMARLRQSCDVPLSDGLGRFRRRRRK